MGSLWLGLEGGELLSGGGLLIRGVGYPFVGSMFGDLVFGVCDFVMILAWVCQIVLGRCEQQLERGRTVYVYVSSAEIDSARGF